MLFQTDEYSCAVAAIQNVFRALGKRVPEHHVRAHSATTPEKGTNEHGIRNALERLGMPGDELVQETKGRAWKDLTKSILGGSPVILLVEHGQHWVAAIGMLGSDRVVVFDSTRTKKNKLENGLHVYNRRQLFKRWTHFEGHHFGIVVRSKKD